MEKLVDGASASVFRGKMHPIDIASRLVRQVEFLSTETATGAQVPNDLVVRMSGFFVFFDSGSVLTCIK